MLKHFSDTFVRWHSRYFSGRSFLFFLSALVGIASAFAAFVIKKLVHAIQMLPVSLNIKSQHLGYFLFPLLGVLITVLITRYFFKGKLEKGFSSLLYAITTRFSKLEKSKMISHVITSSVTVGFGGSAGLEAPIVITGAAIGSNVARISGLGFKERTILLACAAASGITAIFNSPVAGIFFALEVLLTEVTISAFIPLLIAIIPSFILSGFILKQHLTIQVSAEWQFDSIPLFLVLAIICGLVSLYIVHVNIRIQHYLSKTKTWKKAVFGGLTLSLLILILPPLFGEGYTTINELFHGNYSVLLKSGFLENRMNSHTAILCTAILIMLVKVIATTLTIGSGGNGGFIATSLFTGALTGFATAFFMNMQNISHPDIASFMVAGMAGLLSGVIHAPLTSIFMMSELSGGYTLFIPVVMVSVISFLIAKHFEPYSIYERNLVINNNKIFRSDVFSIEDLIEKNFIPLKASGNINSLLKALNVSSDNIYPVVNQNNDFLGIIERDVIEKINQQADLYKNMKVIDVTDTTVIPVQRKDSLDSVVKKLESSKLRNFPVVDGNRFIGFISKPNALASYRKLLKRSALLI